MGATVPEPSAEGLKRQPPKGKGFFASLTEEVLGTYSLTIDKDGVLMSRDFDKTKFELIDSVIQNQGDLPSNQIPKALTTVIRNNQVADDKTVGEKKDNKK
jgi:hypothetical protein